MFKYLRTAASDYQPAEVKEFLSVGSEYPDSAVPKGSFFTVDEGVVQNDYTPSLPNYLALTGKKSDETAYVKCIPVYRNMIFEATISPEEDKNTFRTGGACDISVDDTRKGVYVSMQGGPVFEIIDDTNRDNGTVTIRLM